MATTHVMQKSLILAAVQVVTFVIVHEIGVRVGMWWHPDARPPGVAYGITLRMILVLFAGLSLATSFALATSESVKWFLIVAMLSVALIAIFVIGPLDRPYRQVLLLGSALAGISAASITFKLLWRRYATDKR